MQGDSFYAGFISDGSNNEWGYKFTVRDAGAAGSAAALSTSVTSSATVRGVAIHPPPASHHAIASGNVLAHSAFALRYVSSLQ